MFWKIIRWGGTIIIIAAAITSVLINGSKDEVQPTAPVQNSGSNFNL